MATTIDALEQVHDLYAQGLYLQAYEASKSLGPLRDWSTPAGLVMAGRLAHVLGDDRLGARLHLLAYRRREESPLACYYGIRAVLSRFGPWQAIKAWQRETIPTESRNLHADWHAVYGACLAMLRDFQRADKAIEKALSIAPDRPWIHVEHAYILQAADRFDEGLKAAERSLTIRPWFRPGIQSVAHALARSGRDQDAISLLSAAMEQVEFGGIAAQLADLLAELGEYRQSSAVWEKVSDLYPLADQYHRQWIAARRCDLACRLGDYEAGLRLAREAGKGFYEVVAERLASTPSDAPRAQLNVPFVGQHHVTCAPATLTSLSLYWERPAEHVEVAQAICYDGTPAHSQRRWAEQAGFVARGFTVDWSTCVRLIDRGIPFAMATVEPTSSHLQAVIGYDTRRGTLLIRDPSNRSSHEMLADIAFQRYQATGPRGLVLVPPDKAQQLVEALLPDVDLYEDLHDLESALDRHDRAAAAAALERMTGRAASHYVTLHARRTLAGYDSDLTTHGQVVQELLKKFPDDALLTLLNYRRLEREGTRSQRLEFLESACGRSGMDTTFRLQLADELSADFRDHPRARRLLRRYLRRRPGDAEAYRLLGVLQWDDEQRSQATELFRCAACLGDKNERFAWTYFNSSRHIKGVEESLDFLRYREQTLGDLSGQPTETLFSALMDLHRGKEALDVLERALKRRPDDGPLLVFAADAYGRRGQFQRASELLALAEGKSHRVHWLRTAADLAHYQGDLAQAKTRWLEVAELEPQSADSQDAAARLILETEGRPQALARLKHVVDRFPHNLPLARMACQWLEDGHLPEAEALLRRVIERNPADAWARRELAVVLVQQVRYEEALAEVDHAIALEPHTTYGHSIRGRINSLLNNSAAGRADYQRALQESIDNDAAIRGLVALCGSHAERVEALEFVQRELARQTIFGNGLLCYASEVRGVLDHEQALAKLREALRARNDLWHAWSAVIRQLAIMEKFYEAKLLAQNACNRFPLLPGAWMDLAYVERAQQNVDGEAAALEQARQLSPSWQPPVRALSEVYLRRGQLEQAQALLADAAARSPLDAVTHGCLSDVHWQLGFRDEALNSVERALRLDPGYQWGWGALCDWRQELNQSPLAAEFARLLTVDRPSDARCWNCLARLLSSPEQADERRAAIDKAIELNPRLTEAYELKSRLLCQAKQFDEAIAVCQAPQFGDSPPLQLQIERARVLAARDGQAAGITALRALLSANPDAYEGWKQLARWCCDDADRKSLFLEAGQAVVRLDPDESMSWRIYGDALKANGALDDACKALVRAVILAPGWVETRQKLFDMQLAAGELEAAAATFAPIGRDDADEFTTARHVQLLCAQQDRARAVEVCRRLSRMDTQHEWSLTAAIKALVDKGWGKDVDTILREAIAREDCGVAAWEQWARRWVSSPSRVEGAAKALTKSSHRGAGWRLTCHVVLGELARPKHLATLRSFIGRNRKDFRESTGLWGQVGYALTSSGVPRQALKWLADWKQRKDAKPWMLSNIVVCLQILRRDAAAVDVARYALTLPPDNTLDRHRLWVAAAELGDGHDEEAERLLAEIDAGDSRRRESRLAGLLRETLAIRKDLAGGARLTAKRVTRRLTAAINQGAQSHADRHLQRMFYRYQALIARDQKWRFDFLLAKINCWASWP